MTEEQRKLCRDLIMFPDGRRRITKEEFLRQFPSAVEHGRLALKWLQEAYETRNADDLSYAFVIGGVFGFAPEHKDILLRLIDEDWHYCHEGVVSALQKWPTVDTVGALFRACAFRKHHSATERRGAIRATKRRNLSSLVCAYCHRRSSVQRIRTLSGAW